MAKSVEKLFEKYLSKFEKELFRAVNTEDEEAIHDLRVSIKKIRALLLFLEEAGFANIKSEYPYLTKLKKLFKKAGKLREIHIHKKLYHHYREKTGRDFPQLLEHLERMEEDNRQAYHETMPGIKLRKFYQQADDLQHAIKKISRSTLNKRLFTFIQTRVETCYGFMFEPHYEQHLHQIRKYLKHIRFIIGQKVGDMHELFQEELTFEDTKKVEDILGEWHDRDEFRKLLEEYSQITEKNGDGTTKKLLGEYLNQVKQDIQTDITKLRPELVHVFSLMRNMLSRDRRQME
ncbi:MAG: CHAD domain-containing protein [Bacteroidales bacterium]|nr:CHAD domain-containing protein [Bacteroidales bacterium]